MAWTAPRTWVAGAVLAASEMNTDVRDNPNLLKTCINDSGHIEFVADTALSIVSGAITVTQNVHTVDTESDAASDDLDTITAGTNVGEGFLLFLYLEAAARIVTLKDGTGNLAIGADVVMAADQLVVLYYDGTNWQLVSSGAASANPNILLLVAGAELDATNPPEAIIASGVMHLAFDDTTSQIIRYSFRWPSGYAAEAITAYFGYSMASATSGTCKWSIEVWAVTPGDAVDIDTESFDTANVATDTVPGTAGYLDETSVAVTNADGLVAGDRVVLKISRDVADTATGDAELRDIALVW